MAQGRAGAAAYTGGMPPRSQLSLEELAALAVAAEGEGTPAAVARELGLPYPAVAWDLGRFRREGGWCTRLTLPPCTECGEVVVGPPWQKRHHACVRAIKARWVREERRELRAGGSPEAVEAARLANRRNATRYYGALPQARKAVLLAVWKVTGQRDYELTLASADQSGAHWTEDDDAYIRATMDEPGREVALALGRTNWAVYSRRGKLRRERAPGPRRG